MTTLCDYCNDLLVDTFYQTNPCPFCSEGKPRGSDYPQAMLNIPVGILQELEEEIKHKDEMIEDEDWRPSERDNI